MFKREYKVNYFLAKMYVKYEIEVNQTLYSDYESLRKKWQGDHLSKKDVEELLTDIGFPMKSPRMWELLKNCELINQHGKSRYTYYVFPLDQPPYNRFERLEKEFYNGMSKVNKVVKPKPKDEEKGRIPLSEDFCIDYLKKTGKYLILELNPNVEELKKILNPHLLLDSSDVKLR